MLPFMFFRDSLSYILGLLEMGLNSKFHFGVSRIIVSEMGIEFVELHSAFFSWIYKHFLRIRRMKKKIIHRYVWDDRAESTGHLFL